MRDTARLRRRLERALALASPLVLASCDSGPDPSTAAAASAAESKGKADGPRKAVGPDKASPSTVVKRDPPPPPKPTRFDPIPGDPPWVDGYNPEEASCPSGNWCGLPDVVAPLTVKTGAEVMGCPDRITGAGWKDVKGNKAAYEELSRNPAMLGSFNEGRTVRRRDEGQADMCCYHWFEYCSGRPILEGDDARTAAPRHGSGWRGDPSSAAAALEPGLARELADEWVRDGLAEHAAIASFARATLELLAVGAPADLVARTQQAGIDEVHHARLCFELAARHGGEALEPGPLAPPAIREADLRRLALDTFDEGCVGETIAALQAERALARCADAQASSALARIADDEASHAALAWATLGWCVESGGPAILEALRRHARARLAALRDAPAPADNPLAPHGRLAAHDRVVAARDAWRDIIAPMLEQLG